LTHYIESAICSDVDILRAQSKAQSVRIEQKRKSVRVANAI